MDKQDMIDFMKETLSEVMGEDITDIDENTSFFKLGISSVDALKTMNVVGRKLNIEIDPAAMFEYKNIAEMAEYLQTLTQ